MKTMGRDKCVLGGSEGEGLRFVVREVEHFIWLASGGIVSVLLAYTADFQKHECAGVKPEREREREIEREREERRYELFRTTL